MPEACSCRQGVEPVTHDIKTWPVYFEAVARGEKPFEVRRDDRNGFRRGDLLRLLEFDPASCEFTGRVLTRRVTFVLEGGGEDAFGLAEGYVVMGLAEPKLADGQLELTPLSGTSGHEEVAHG